MFRTLMTALRSRRTPAPLPSRATRVGELQVTIVADTSEFIDALPVRVPADEITQARRHTWAAVGHALGAIRDTDHWHDTASAADARVRHIAAIHQIDAALAALAAARRALPSSATKETLR